MIRAAYIGAISSQRHPTEVVTERNITGAAAQSPVSFDYNTPWTTVEASLPSLIIATLDDGTQAPLGIDWLQGSYNPIVANTYSINGDIELLTGITNSTNIQGSINVTVNPQIAYDIYLSTSGNDANDGLTAGSPVLTLAVAHTKAVALGGPRTIKATAGTFTLTEFQQWNAQISFAGEGIDVTYIKGNASLNFAYNINAFQWAFDKYLIQATSGGTTNGNQTFRDFTIDGDNRAKHGGIYVNNRNNVTFKNVKFNKFNFSGLYFISTDNMKILDCVERDCSDSTSIVSSGGIMCGHNSNTLIDNLDLNEGRGYGIKAFGPAPVLPIISNFRLINSNLSIFPSSAYGGGGIPNIAIELHDVFMSGSEIANNYFDGNVSIVPTRTQAANYNGGAQVIRIHHNTFDMITRANGGSYCLEQASHNIEIDHNYFYGGSNAAIASWNSGDAGLTKTNWSIHHNIFYRQQSFYPAYLVRSGYHAIANLNFYNNTVAIDTNNTVYVIGTERSGANSNWNIKNNVILDESTANDQWGSNQLISLGIGATLSNLVVDHNCIFGMPIGSISGSGNTYTNNMTSTNPQLTKVGAKPDPFYRPLPTSPLLNAGINVGLPFTGSAPTIGAYEEDEVTVSGDIVSVSSFPARSITTGIAFANLGLPATVEVTLDDDSTIILAVTWGQGSYNPSVEDTFNLVGTLTLVPGVTNTGLKTAAIAITTTDAVVYFTDSFDRASLGSNYTVQGNATASLDGADMTLAVTGAGGNTSRIVRNVWDDTIDNAKISIIFSPSDVTTSSNGKGIGFQNAVNPNPNLGVYLFFDTSTLANAGRIFIVSGDGTLSNSSFITRQGSATSIPVIQDRRYLLELTRELIGADAVFTGTVTDLVTNASVTVVWTEDGAVSMNFAQQITIYQLGGTAIVEDLTAYDLDPVTSTVLLDDTFNRTLLSPWTEVDNANELTVTMNNPYVTLTSAVFAPSRMITYGTLGTGLNSWRMTIDFRFLSGSGGGLWFGTKNQPVNPNANRAILARVDQSASKLKMYAGGGTTNDDLYNLQDTSSGSMTFTNNLDYRVVLERTYNGSGDAVYDATVFLISSPGTTITSTYTSTSAPEQALYASTRWSISVLGNSVQVRRVLIEEL